jgi:hypothetical protein
MGFGGGTHDGILDKHRGCFPCQQELGVSGQVPRRHSVQGTSYKARGREWFFYGSVDGERKISTAEVAVSF